MSLSAHGGGDEESPSAALSERRSIGRNLFDLLSSQAVTWVLATMLAVVQPRFIGDVGQGQLRLATSLWMIVDVLLTLGTNTYLTLETAKDRDRGLALVRPLMRWRLTTFVIGWIAMFVYVVASGASTEFTIVIVLIGVVTMLTAVSAIGRATLTGLENLGVPARIDVTTKVASVVVVLTVLIAGGRLIAVAVVAVVTAALHATLMLRALRRFRPQAGTPHDPFRVIVRASLGFLLSNASLIVYQQVDTVIMSLLVDERRLGWYAAADQLFATFLFVPTILTTTLFPVFARLNAERPDQLRQMMSRSITTLLFFSVPIGLGIVAVGNRVAPLVFGSQFAGAGPVLAVLGVVVILSTETILLGRFAIATGQQRFWNVLMLSGIAMTIPLDLVLVPWTESRFDNGAIGGALAYVVTETFMFVAGLLRLARSTLSLEAADRAIRILLSGGAMFAAAWALRDEVLVVPILAGALTYVLAIFVTGALGPEERAVLRSVRAKLRRS